MDMPDWLAWATLTVPTAAVLATAWMQHRANREAHENARRENQEAHENARRENQEAHESARRENQEAHESARRENQKAHGDIHQRIARAEDTFGEALRAQTAALQAAVAAADKRADEQVAALRAAEARADKRADEKAAALRAQTVTLQALAREVSFLSGRQAERDAGQPGQAGPATAGPAA